MPDVGISVTPGSGANIRAFQNASNYDDQYVREVRGTTTVAPNSWTVTTAGSASVVAADVTRVGLLIVSNANGIVYLRFDSTIPTATTFSWLLNPGDRWDVPVAWTQFAVSMAGSVAGGTVLTTTALAA